MKWMMNCWLGLSKPMKMLANMIFIKKQPRLFSTFLFLLFLMAGCSGTPAVLTNTPIPIPTEMPTQVYTLKPQSQPYYREKPLEYYLYLPKNYTADRAWPLFVNLHGAGGNAYDCLYTWQKYADDEGFVLMCPSLEDPTGGWENDEKKVTLHETINAVRQECHIQNEIFLTGFSRGGHLAQRFAWAYPDAVGAVTVLSAVTYDTPEKLSKDIPFLTVIGDYDHTNGIEQVKTFTEQLKKVGFSAEFQILPDTGHLMTDAASQLTLEFFRKTVGKAVQP